MRFSLLFALLANLAATPLAAHDPVFAGADPDMVALCRRWWVYPTDAGVPNGAPPCPRILRLVLSRSPALDTIAAAVVGIDARARDERDDHREAERDQEHEAHTVHER
jgi:hypothetical protein